MVDPDEIAVIHKAQQGDAEAFNALVIRYQDLVAGTAFGWLGDLEATRDVTQEVFLEAHLKLGQLREPAAFPGWLRRIVIKQCDRVTRRRSLVTTPIDGVAGEGLAEKEGPEHAAETDEVADQLRFAVEGLPVPERQVIALHYFAEATGPELADYLELPLSTVKKRLRSARAKLRNDGERMMQSTMDSLRPSRSPDLSREVSFFIALRAGDRTEVSRLLEVDPSLLNAHQSWEPELALAGLLPFAKQATALITSVELDDLDMLRLLLAAGAEVNGACGCATGESPLWAATLLNRPEHALLLLAAGADPNAPSAGGNLPLHLAAMRGYGELVDLLLANGADATLEDAGPLFPRPFAPADGKNDEPARTAKDWALANGHYSIADRLQRATGDLSESSQVSTPEAVQLINSLVYHTGIKALDLLSPLRRGGIVRVPFKAGVGMIVLLGELCRRFCARTDGAAIWIGFAQPPFDLQDWQADMSEFGLADQVAQRLASFNEPAEVRREVFVEGVELATSLRDLGQEVLVIVQCAQGFDGEVDAGLLRLSEPGQSGSITTVVITDFPERDNVWSTLQAPYSGQLTLDRTRSAAHLFPAIAPDSSVSTAASVELLGERHLAIAEQVREILANYAERDPAFERLEANAEQSGAGLLRYLCQPFFVTEPFTGRQGEWVDRATLLDDLEGLIGS